MTTKYVARLNGQIVGKRTTKDRTYTHAIVTQRVEEIYRAEAYDYVATPQDRANFAYYSSVVAQGLDHEYVRPTTWRQTHDHKLLADATARVEGGFDGYVARQRAELIARFEADKAAGNFNPRAVAWAGRLDLAQKAVAQHTNRRVKLVAIVPAEVA